MHSFYQRAATAALAMGLAAMAGCGYAAVPEKAPVASHPVASASPAPAPAPSSAPSATVSSAPPAAPSVAPTGRPAAASMDEGHRLMGHPTTREDHPVTYPAPANAPPPAPLYWFGSPAGGHVYITIDDGWVPSARVLSLMQRTHVPLTAFLIEDAVREHLAYWRAFAAAGGVIEDHTLSHPDLALVPYTEDLQQWQQPLAAYRQWFGQLPTVGRPPYGGVDPTVQRAATAAGLHGIVMWSAVMEPSGLVTWNHGPLEPGEIILLHWDPGLYGELQRLLAVIAARHLVPAPLLSGLPASAG